MKKFMKKAGEKTEKIVNVAGKTMHKAKDFAGDVSQIVKLELELAENKKTLKKLFYEYGKSCYYNKSTEIEKAELRAKINEYESLIGILEKSIKAVKEEM